MIVIKKSIRRGFILIHDTSNLPKKINDRGCPQTEIDKNRPYWKVARVPHIGTPWSDTPLTTDFVVDASLGRCSRHHRSCQRSKGPRLCNPAPVHRQTVWSDETSHHGGNHRDIAHQSKILSSPLVSQISWRAKRGNGGMVSRLTLLHIVLWPRHHGML